MKSLLFKTGVGLSEKNDFVDENRTLLPMKYNCAPTEIYCGLQIGSVICYHIKNRWKLCIFGEKNGNFLYMMAPDFAPRTFKVIFRYLRRVHHTKKGQKYNATLVSRF